MNLIQILLNSVVPIWSIFPMVLFPKYPKDKKDHIGTMRKRTILGPGSEAQPWARASPGTRLGGAAQGRPGASEPGPRAGPCPWLCLRAGSQYSLFSHGPNLVDFICWNSVKIDHAEID